MKGKNNAEIQRLIKEARTAVDSGDVAKSKELRDQITVLRDQDTEAAELDTLEHSYTVVRPDLPNTKGGDAALPNVESSKSKGGKGGNTSVVDEDEDEEDEDDSDEELDLRARTQKAAYITRFGQDEKSIIKAILTDLHGKNFQGAYWEQKAAFNRYLRAGPERLRGEEKRALRQIVMTPSAVKMALDQGLSDVQSYRATMVEAADSLGGVLVPIDFQMRMISRLAALTVIRGRASQMNTSRDRVEMPEATGGNGRYTSPVRVQWVDETPTIGQLTPNYLTFGLRGIDVHTAMAEAPISRNLLDDVAFDIESYLASKLAEAVALDEDQQFTIGNGVGKPHGILPGSVNGMSLDEIHSGAGSALTWDGLIAMTYGIDAQYRQQGVWLANRATYLAIAKLRQGDNYLWQNYQFTGGEQGRTTTLLGYPILESELMPDVATNSFPIVFGDLAAYQIVDRLGLSVERFIDSGTARQNLAYFVMRRRLGGELVETWKMVVQKVAT